MPVFFFQPKHKFTVVWAAGITIHCDYKKVYWFRSLGNWFWVCIAKKTLDPVVISAKWNNETEISSHLLLKHNKSNEGRITPQVELISSHPLSIGISFNFLDLWWTQGSITSVVSFPPVRHLYHPFRNHATRLSLNRDEMVVIVFQGTGVIMNVIYFWGSSTNRPTQWSTSNLVSC